MARVKASEIDYGLIEDQRQHDGMVHDLASAEPQCLSAQMFALGRPDPSLTARPSRGRSREIQI
jgi:hypothetical protein